MCVCALISRAREDLRKNEAEGRLSPGSHSPPPLPTLPHPTAVLHASQEAHPPKGGFQKAARNPRPGQAVCGDRGGADRSSEGARGAAAPRRPAARPTGDRGGGGRPRCLRLLLRRRLPLPLLVLLDEAEVGAAELGSGGRGHEPRLQQHSRQAEKQGAGDAPTEPRHGREPQGRGGILRGSGRRPS